MPLLDAPDSEQVQYVDSAELAKIDNNYNFIAIMIIIC